MNTQRAIIVGYKTFFHVSLIGKIAQNSGIARLGGNADSLPKYVISQFSGHVTSQTTTWQYSYRQGPHCSRAKCGTHSCVHVLEKGGFESSTELCKCAS